MNRKTDFIKVLKTLKKHQVEFLIVGGISAVLHGAPVTTFDLDILHKRTEENVDRLRAALAELGAHYRAKRNMKIKPSKEALLGKGHHLLLTEAGSLDVLGVVGVMDNFKEYDDLRQSASTFQFAGISVLVQDLVSLIETKKLVGRNKDLAVIPILEQTLLESSEE